MNVLAVGARIGRDGGVVVAVDVDDVVAAAVGVKAEVAVGVEVATVVDGEGRGCIEANWGGGMRGGIVGVGGVGADGPTSEVGGVSRMGTIADPDRSRKRRWRNGVVAGQDAWMAPCRCGLGIGHEGFGGVVAAGVSKLAVDSLSARLGVEA